MADKNAEAPTPEQFEALIARLEALESAASENQKLKAENQLLAKQMEANGGRRQSEQEAHESARRIMEFNTVKRDPKAEYQWRVTVRPAGKKNDQGKPLTYRRALEFHSRFSDPRQACLELQHKLGTTLTMQNSQWEAVDFVPEGYEEEQAASQPELFAVN